MESFFTDIYHALLKNKNIPKFVCWLYISVFFVLLTTIFFLAGFSILNATGLAYAIGSWVLCGITMYFWVVITLRIIRYKR